MLKYDNCKNCVSKCEYAGKDREFVCPGGKSCKVLYTPEEKARAAADFVNAIQEIARKPGNLANFESYLKYHFPEWLEKYARTPGDMAAEIKAFAQMEV